MNYGFLKVAAATPQIKVADVQYNTKQIINLVDSAYEQGVKVLCFSELCLTGYTCGDLFLQPTLLSGVKTAIKELAVASVDKDIVFVVGAPISVNNKLYNCAVIIQDGNILGVVPKTHLPNYGEFYEARQFTSAPKENTIINLCGQTVAFGTDLLFGCTNFGGLLFGVEICEDLWVSAPPSIGLAQAGATLVLNLSASDETIGKKKYRQNLVSMQSSKCLCGYVYANAGEGESTTDMVFAGHNLIAQNGALVANSELFTTGLTVGDIDLSKIQNERLRTSTFETTFDEKYIIVPFGLCEEDKFTLSKKVNAYPFVPQNEQTRAQRCSDILNMQAMGLKKRIAHTGCRSVVVGLSGGLDSTLALLVMVRAMDLLNRPRTDILAVTMPCFGTTKRTKTNAQRQAESLGVSFKTVNIAASVTRHLKDIGHDLLDQSVTYENAQARERTQVLMDLANKNGGLVIGTGDLSELALGFATYNGDHMSMYGVNASIPKTLVRHLVAYEAQITSDKKLKSALLDILNTPVSPELLPAKDGEISQCTEEIVGPYDLHDFFLYHFVRNAFEPEKIYFLAQNAFEGQFDSQTILKWLKVFVQRFFSQQFKRSCLPDGPKVGSVTLSPRGDWRMPSDAEATLWLNQLQNL